MTEPSLTMKMYWCTTPVAGSFFWRFFASQNSNNNRIEKADRNDLRLALALRMAPVPSKNYGRNLTSIILSAKKNLRLQAMCTNTASGTARRGRRRPLSGRRQSRRRTGRRRRTDTLTLCEL